MRTAYPSLIPCPYRALDVYSSRDLPSNKSTATSLSASRLELLPTLVVRDFATVRTHGIVDTSSATESFDTGYDRE